jgi:hypothetical protein
MVNLTTVLRALVAGALIGTGATCAWLGGLWVYTMWQRR